MSSGSAQDVAVEHFLRDIERRGEQLHCTVIGQEGANPHARMNLLYRRSRMDWRNREAEARKKGSGEKDSSVTVGKGRDLASFRRHFRMGFMTMPACQDLSPRPCASAMAPRSQSCHAVGGGLEDGGDDPPPPLPTPSSTTSASSSAARCPPAKPKRHPSTRLSSTPDIPLQDTPKPTVPPPQLPAKHPEKRSESGEGSGVKKVPPLKPRRSPNTHLSLDPPPPRVPPPAPPSTTPIPRPSQVEAGLQGVDGDVVGEEDEPVYIEMVGQVFTRDVTNTTPATAVAMAPTVVASTPDSDSDQSEAIYEEMKYSHLEAATQNQTHPGHAPQHRLEKPKTSKQAPAPSPLRSTSKPKSSVSISHSSPLPTTLSSPSTPAAAPPLSPSPQPLPRAPTPFLLPSNKHQNDPSAGNSSNKIPAPFPNLLQHRPPLLALPQPAATSSGVGTPQNKPPPPKLGTVSIQAPVSLISPGTQTASKLPVPHQGSKDPLAAGGGGEKTGGAKEAFLGPAPGLRARSHSTPLPPSSSSQSHYANYTPPHHHLHPSHYHHYRRPDRDLPTSHSMKLGPQASASASTQAQTQTQTPPPGGPKEGKSVAFLLKPDKREREKERERDTRTQTSQTTPTPTSSSPAQPPSGSAPSPAPPSSSSSQRPSSRLLQRSHTPAPTTAPQGLPFYKPPTSDSPLLWTYPSVGLRGRPPAYDSLRGGGGVPPEPPSLSATAMQQRKGGSLTRDGGLGGFGGSPATMQRKLSFSHSREIEREESRAWNGSTDALSWPEREEQGMVGHHSAIPVRCGRGGGGAGEGGAGGVARGMGSPGPGQILARSGLPLPCQPFPAFPQNGELAGSTSVSALKQQGGSVHRQSSLPPGGVLSQLQARSLSLNPPGTPPMLSHQQHLHLQLHYQHLAQLAQVQAQPLASGGAVVPQGQRDGKVQEVIERKRYLCREIKAHRRPDRGLCKQDSMPILPSWKKGFPPEPSKGAPNSQAQQAVLWDTAI
ncbi:hypothetical protein AGOR_G00019910 [Albula goreensis]|uniref:Neuronal tyrosine-phosphorylated phosphoinositide-3-kinase adapter 1 n=1 Tax=Albula goreensis TaxID=1534307 RepID=A0A8T3E3G2_9TELE|nr:hypothetical protein AGOR_G00019910 [Albula goreensis]